MKRLPFRETIQALPVEWEGDTRDFSGYPDPSIEKIAVLDDDPTGTQTVHSIPVLTDWLPATLEPEFTNQLPAFYILTNSRSMLPQTADQITREIGANLKAAAKKCNRKIKVVSRGDSTLRGHFPVEMESLASSLQEDFDGWLIIPFLPEGGRYTINDVHYVLEGDWLTPAGETTFARDKAFGYRSSNLKDWVEEKTEGRIRADQVASISIQDIRCGGPSLVQKELSQLSNGKVCIVNAVSRRDIEVFVVGLRAAESAGKRFLPRTAATFVSVYLGMESRPLLSCQELDLPERGGGLIMVGSYVPRTTAQVSKLLDDPEISGVEVDVAKLIHPEQRETVISQAAYQAEKVLARDKDVAVYTSRNLIAGSDAESSLEIGNQVSNSLIEILAKIKTRPRYLLAKGGITSSDIATKGLFVHRGMILGQIAEGVSAWRLGPESRYPGMLYIVFPGNVGGAETLAELVSSLKRIC